MKRIALASLALGFLAVPALAEDATNDPFGGRVAHNAPEILSVLTAPQSVDGLDMTATASIGQGVVLEAGETEEIIFNRFNR